MQPCYRRRSRQLWMLASTLNWMLYARLAKLPSPITKRIVALMHNVPNGRAASRGMREKEGVTRSHAERTGRVPRGDPPCCVVLLPLSAHLTRVTARERTYSTVKPGMYLPPSFLPHACLALVFLNMCDGGQWQLAPLFASG